MMEFFDTETLSGFDSSTSSEEEILDLIISALNKNTFQELDIGIIFSDGTEVRLEIDGTEVKFEFGDEEDDTNV